MTVWQDAVKEDVSMLGAELVAKAMADTSDELERRRYSRAAVAALKWNRLAFWALPRAGVQDLQLLDGLYFRPWVCALDGISVDGHVSPPGFCAECGEVVLG